jgi:hypothetical protein
MLSKVIDKVGRPLLAIRGTDLIVLQLITLKSGTPKPQNLDPQNHNHFALDPEGRFSHLYLAVS